VNLIGEHVDYNDGFVLPFALGFRTVVVASFAPDSSGGTSKVLTCMAGLEPVSFVIGTDSMVKGKPTWGNYVKGTIAQYLDFIPAGMAINAVIASDVPMGSGLSSSASLEVATATLIEAMLAYKGVAFSPSDGVAKALRCQKAEHDWADTPCGIMDQYISALGKEGQLLLIDCRTNESTLVPFGSEGAEVPVCLIANTNVKHTLSGSEYPDRVRQCKECVAVMQGKGHDIAATRDATMDMLEDSKDSMSDMSYRRGRHCVTEDARTLASVEALKAGDWVSVGAHMSASHASLRDDFEVSCPELDVLQRLALEVPGVYGSRMTGGGFGGCTITLVKAEALDALKAHLCAEYPKHCPDLQCSLYASLPSAGSGLC
jgi:galactokinase